MALYRRRSRGLTALSIVAATAAALAVGFIAGRATAPEATLEQFLGPVRTQLRRASGALDIVELEYRRAVEEGSSTSLDAARSAVGEASNALTVEGAVLSEIYPQRYARAVEAAGALQRTVEREDDLDAVLSRIRELRAALERIMGRR